MVVTEGFAGNIALKSAGDCREWRIRTEMRRTIFTRLGYLGLGRLSGPGPRNSIRAWLNGGVFQRAAGTVSLSRVTARAVFSVRH